MTKKNKANPLKEKESDKEEISNPLYGMPFSEALKAVAKGGKPKKKKKKEGQ